MTDMNRLKQALVLAMSSAQASRPWFEERVSGNKGQEGGSARVGAAATMRGDLRAMTRSALYSQSPAECPLWGYLAGYR